MPWERIQRLHNWVYKKAGAILLALAAAIYRTGQDLGYFPKEIYIFPLLVAAFVAFCFYLFVASNMFKIYLDRFYVYTREGHRMAAYIIVAFSGALVGCVLAVGGYYLFEIHKKHIHALSNIESSKDKKRIAAEPPQPTPKKEQTSRIQRTKSPKETTNLKPQVDNSNLSKPNINIDAFLTPIPKSYQGPLKKYKVIIFNRNITSASVYDFRLEFMFDNAIASIRQWPTMSGNNVGIIEFHTTKEDGSEQWTTVNKNPMPNNCSFTIQNTEVDNKAVNTNTLVFNCERWPRNIKILSAEIILDTSKKVGVQKGPEGTYKGVYFYEVNGQALSERINGVIRVLGHGR